ncbi:MAG: double-strand break repair protein AddB [Rhodobacteraceae bacterium]|nr:double-strand break repair protein AddB [Paracoccaceae bacterium]
MFEPASKPRLFYVPPGADFPREVVRGLEARLKDHAAWARMRLLVNAARMKTRLEAVFGKGPARLLPQMSLITDLGALDPSLTLGEGATAGLRRQLDLAANLKSVPGLTAYLDVARSLATLIDEMDGEGVSLETLNALNVADHGGHWERALAIVKVAALHKPGLGPEAVARARTLALIENWQTSAPESPLLVAGSTGSRGTTSLLMEAVSKLPQGALILPGFDPNTPQNVWDTLQSSREEDHPQYRYADLLKRLECTPEDVVPWSDAPTPNWGRTRLISLSLRPAPVTHHWLEEGPKLGDLSPATQDVTLIEAKDQSSEAAAIALRLRQAAEDGISAALISPDRGLTRRVTAALARWSITPDDSAGAPLSLTPPGRLLLQIAALGAKGVAADTLIALLKHPLVATGGARGEHLQQTRALELHLRRRGPPFPTEADILDWAAQDDTRGEWSAWLAPLLAPNPAENLADHLAWLRQAAEAICAGPGGENAGELWEEAPGRKTKDVYAGMEDVATDDDTLTAAELVTILAQTFAGESVTVVNDAHPYIMIWGTLEARAQGADIVILAGLNDGVWPGAAAPDPWMNRAMRHDAGLLSPERQIGLSAHDYQQAACAREIWLTRATKSDDAETVPSRWLNRLMTLLEGLPDQGGRDALDEMRGRGQVWLDLAARLDLAGQTRPALRPSPIPPNTARPRKLSVTEIRTLIRDPYAIYAKHVLRLRELDPLAQTPDARLRGIVLHDVMQALSEGLPEDADEALTQVEATADKILSRTVPWPAARKLWKARFMRAAPWFVETEASRREGLAHVAAEKSGAYTLRDQNFTLTGKADRIDVTNDGHARIYDYKTGNPPSPEEQKYFDKQLPLEALMIAAGAFPDVGALPVDKAAYIGLGSKPQEQDVDLSPDYQAEFVALITAMLDPEHGFTARRAMQKDTDASPYDLLSRFGEWGPTDDPKKVRV